MTIAKPLLHLVRAEKRIKEVEPRDFRADPWLAGEGARFFTPDRLAKMAAENEQRRKARKVELLPSDREVIEARIEARCAKTANELS